MISSSDFAYVFCLGNKVGVSENYFRQEKIVPVVGESRSYDVMGNIRFGAFAISFDCDLRNQLMHYDDSGNAYIIVDAFDTEAKVYVKCGDGCCIVVDISF